jgi:hypothetical protein
MRDWPGLVASTNCLSPADAPSAEIPAAAWELGENRYVGVTPHHPLAEIIA